MALVLLLQLAACTSAQEVGMKIEGLPIPETLPDTLVIYENIALDSDRSANWRFFFRTDGCFFHARNEELHISDPAELEHPDPALHWNTAWPSEPIRCLHPQQLERLRDAISKAHTAGLKPVYEPPRNEQTSHSTAERWTLSAPNHQALAVVVINDSAPPSLVSLRTTIDQLLAENPTPDS